MRKLILLSLLIMSIWGQSQNNGSGQMRNRVQLGEQTILQVDRSKFATLNILYKEQEGYSGNFDKPFIDHYPPFAELHIISLSSANTILGSTPDPDRKLLVNHIQDESNSIFIWPDFWKVKQGDDCLKNLRWDLQWNMRKVQNADSSKECVRDYVTYMPDTYAKRAFNADTVVMYSLDMEGKKINDRYTHHKAIVAYNRDGRMLELNCFLTEEGLKNFDEKYLKDVEDMWHFEDKE